MIDKNEIVEAIRRNGSKRWEDEAELYQDKFIVSEMLVWNGRLLPNVERFNANLLMDA